MSAIREGGVAVITGAASGIGYALAEEALRRGMSVVVADIREEALAEAAKKLEGQGANVLAVLADVTSEENIIALRDQAIERLPFQHVRRPLFPLDQSMTWEPAS